MKRCRSCGGNELVDVLDLGCQPLANELPLDPNAAQERFRLNLVFCPACALMQIDETVPPERLFSDYVYRSSFADSMLAHVRLLVERLIAERRLNRDSLVVEAASNDGYLLQYYRERGIPVLGIEPAANIAEIALRERGIPTDIAFFDDGYAAGLARRGVRCDVFHAHNVIAHVPDPNPFLRGVARVLKPDGIAVIEAPYVRDLVDGLQFDTVYHEHFSYFGATSFAALAARNGLKLIDVEHVPIHGGSLRYVLGLEGSRAKPAVRKILDEERRSGLASPAYYQSFARRVGRLSARLKSELDALKAAGATLAAYGASAKGSTLVNTLKLGPETIAFAVDRNPLKQGRHMPGQHIPILAPSALRERRPDCVLLLTWNFADEIIAQQRDYLEAGGRFLIPLPEPRFIDRASL
ncbi:MAG: class I SAM-dependent methyltransferase [Hyphomicrobiales bacterium]|nr:class I SAM-dependent methyltransferase [Hyphomicrobiales bacterium]